MADQVGDTKPEYDAVIIGAGFAGLYMLHRLVNELGLRTRLFEAGGDVGGTWYWNRYPGARSDSDGYVYCYSFSPELSQEWNWSQRYPTQAEMHSYLSYVADRFDLRRHMSFDANVDGAEFDEPAGAWHVSVRGVGTVSCRFLITGVGHLSIAKYVPDIPGLDSFRGRWYHTASWPSAEQDISGLRVGVVGTGSTGVQLIPVLAQRAAHLTVFQRSAQYAVPARHEVVDAEFLAKVKRNYSEIWQAAKHSAGGFPWANNGKSALEVSDAERNRIYEALWMEGGMRFALGSFRDLASNREANDTISEFIRAKIRERVKRLEMRDALVPASVPFLARRPIVETEYFETYNRDNVSLVDISKFAIDGITESGVRVGDRVVDLDVLVFATGFDAVTGPFFRMDLSGRSEVRIRDHWSRGPRSYLGVQTAGFPNLFMITGPGTATGNLPVVIEHHVEWISECISFMRQSGYRVVEATAKAEADWTAQVTRYAERSIVSLADSWYTGANIPGKARSFAVFLGHYGRYREQLDRVAAAGYPGFAFSV
jgi:cation diffusion facilitator CzcD-associated flavoprotein CzcO